MTWPLLMKLPVFPPCNRTVVELSWPVISMVPELVRLLELSRVAATGPATLTVAPDETVTLSGPPLLAVEVFTSLVVEPTAVSARAGPTASSNSGAAAAADNKNLRMRERLQPRSPKRLSKHRPPAQQGWGRGAIWTEALWPLWGGTHS